MRLTLPYVPVNKPRYIERWLKRTPYRGRPFEVTKKGRQAENDAGKVTGHFDVEIEVF
jgi:hypothetical protein